MGPDRVGLEHHGEATLLGRYVQCSRRVENRDAVDHDAAGAWRLETGDGAQRRGLAAAGGPEQGDMLALGYGEIDAVHRGDRPITHREPLGGEKLVAHASTSRCRARMKISVGHTNGAESGYAC